MKQPKMKNYSTSKKSAKKPKKGSSGGYHNDKSTIGKPKKLKP